MNAFPTVVSHGANFTRRMVRFPIVCVQDIRDITVIPYPADQLTEQRRAFPGEVRKEVTANERELSEAVDDAFPMTAATARRLKNERKL